MAHGMEIEELLRLPSSARREPAFQAYPHHGYDGSNRNTPGSHASSRPISWHSRRHSSTQWMPSGTRSSRRCTALPEIKVDQGVVDEDGVLQPYQIQPPHLYGPLKKTAQDNDIGTDIFGPLGVAADFLDQPRCLQVQVIPWFARQDLRALGAGPKEFAAQRIIAREPRLQ